MNTEIWTVCNSCNQRVTGNSIHTCSPQLKDLTDEEILDLCPPNHSDMMNEAYTIDFARAILRKAQEK